MFKYLNIGSFLYSLVVIFFKRKLAQPHFCFNSINDIDPEKLKESGCQGVILDKDNTITFFYENELAPQVADTVNEFKKVFGKNLVILSNTASNTEINGIQVLKRSFKKPFGISSVEKYFKENKGGLAIIGDRVFTDIVFGNRHNFLTFYCNPLDLKKKSRIYRWVIKFKRSLIKKL